MARTLPWMKQGGSTKPAAETNHRNKRQKTLQPDPDTGAGRISKPRTLRTVERTPSTSPPPLPPSQHKMRPGWDADDIYIMVEDEFLATAQLFTKHLHHAEYVRLKKEARDRSAEAIKQITRPVDMKTTMSEETRKKKQAESRSDTVKAGLEKLGIKKAPNSADSAESETEQEKADDPWRGTHLHGLMTASPKKTAASLTGLQGPTSATRAAAGHQRQKRSSQTGRDRDQVQPAGASTRKANNAAPTELESSEDDEDDDLDRPTAIHRTKAPAPTKIPNQLRQRETSPSPTKPQQKTSLKPTTAPKRSFLDLSPLPKPPIPQTQKPSQHNNLPPPPHNSSISTIPAEPSDPYSPQTSSLRSDLVRKRLEERKKNQERIKKREEASAGPDTGDVAVAGLTDEIPLFLA